jgi:hypothetical protein
MILKEFLFINTRKEKDLILPERRARRAAII